MLCEGPVFNITRERCDAVLFDLDGVVTKTARVHADSWKRLFDEYLERRAAVEGVTGQPFDVESDYRTFVDGKPRYEGVRCFLESRGIDLPYGEPDDPPDVETVCGLGNRKNLIFNEQLELNGVETYGLAVEMLRLLKGSGFRTAVVSSSKNCGAVLAAAGIGELFDVEVDGAVSEKLGLKGKPEPDTFLEAVRRLDVVPERAVVLEDALSGVRAGKRGRFGCVIGVDRAAQAGALKESGAHFVVSSFGELAVDGERPVMCRGMEELPPALGSMDGIAEQIEGKRLLVALDYDGTLTPIVERPELAVLSDGMRRTVADLAGVCTVAVISGRDLEDVRELVGLDGLFYAGSHGFDISGPAGRQVISRQGSEFLPLLDSAEKMLGPLLEGIGGALVERKKFSVAVHYRMVEESRVPEVEAIVAGVLKNHAGLRRGLGKKVFELQPAIDWHKGKALTWLMKALGMEVADVLPVYLGDDVTDEDAFKVIQSCGIGIVVKDDSGGTPRSSAARYTLEDCARVREFLERLAEMLRGGNR